MCDSEVGKVREDWDGRTTEAGAGSYPEPTLIEKPLMVCDRCGDRVAEVYEVGGYQFCSFCFEEIGEGMIRRDSGDTMMAYIDSEKDSHDLRSTDYYRFLYRNFFMGTLTLDERMEIIEKAFREKMHGDCSDDWIGDLRGFLLRDECAKHAYTTWRLENDE